MSENADIVEWTPLKENTFRMILHRTWSLIYTAEYNFVNNRQI